MKNQTAAVTRRLSDPDFQASLVSRCLALTLGMGALLALALAHDAIVWLNPVQPRYFFVDGKNPPKPVVALDSPIVDDTELLEWTVKAILAPYRSGPVLNGAGSAGPRRLAVMGLIACSVIIVVTVVMMSGRQAPIVSRDARMSPVDPLPGGLHSTPEQDALARRSSDDLAQAALGRGVSFTPPLGPSVPAVPLLPRAEPAAASDLARSKPRFVGR